MTNSRIRNVVLVSALLACGAPPHAVELEQLWLPKSYLRHLPRLYDAAQLVEESSRCAEFITGTVAEDQSSLDHPVFKFRCRNPDRQTYGLLVDGLSLAKLDDTRPGGQVSFEQLEKEYQLELELVRERERKQEELARLREQQRQEEEERLRKELWLEEERKRWQSLWDVCRSALRDRVGGMSKLVWLTDDMPEPEFEIEPEVGEQLPVDFVIDFNAEDLHGQSLAYRTRCTIAGSEDYQLQIRPRRDESGSAPIDSTPD